MYGKFEIRAKYSEKNTAYLKSSIESKSRSSSSSKNLIPWPIGSKVSPTQKPRLKITGETANCVQRQTGSPVSTSANERLAGFPVATVSRMSRVARTTSRGSLEIPLYVRICPIKCESTL